MINMMIYLSLKKKKRDCPGRYLKLAEGILPYVFYINPNTSLLNPQ